jgi:hypothetical protein
VAVGVLDLHRVPDPGDPLLDRGQLVPVRVLQDQGLAQPQRHAVHLVRPLSAVGPDIQKPSPINMLMPAG